MSRVAIVGVEGSGKTVLMAALADRFGTPSKDCRYLLPESQSSFEFMNHIPHKMRVEHQWPSATTIESFKHLKWSMRIGQEVLMEIEMLDYPGELYRMAFGARSEDELEPHRESIHEFLEHLVTADILVVLFNLRDALDVGGNPRNAETVWLTRSIFEYAKKLPNVHTQLLLFTQADRYAQELSALGGARGAMGKHLPMLEVLFPELECRAVSVSTDMSEPMPGEFSENHSVAQFMDWLSHHTQEHMTVAEELRSLEYILLSDVHREIVEIKQLVKRVEAIDPRLSEQAAPGLRDKLFQFCDAKLFAATIAECDAIRDALSSTIFGHISEIAQHICRYKKSLAAVCDSENTDDSDLLARLEEHCKLCRVLSFIIEGGNDSHPFGYWQRLSRDNWLPLYHNLKVRSSCACLENFERFLRFDAKLTLFVSALIGFGLLGLAVAFVFS